MALDLKPAHGPEAVQPAAEPVRLMVVDDSLTARTILSRLVDREDDITVVATASSAERALHELERKEIDVILLDLEMPGMGGLEALPRLLKMREGTQILVVSSLTDNGAEATLSALSMGAADTMLKPRPGDFGEEYRNTLLGKIRAVGRSNAGAEDVAASPRQTLRAASRKEPELIAIGASTGGIHALCLLLRELPSHFTLPIVVTQHLPFSFMQVFARQLELASGRAAILAEEGTEIAAGSIVVAPGDGHLLVRRKGGRLVASLSHLPAASGCLPSVDPMFASIAQNLEGHALGIVLSGMGRDGSEGARELVAAGARILVQDEASSAVWGMPGAIAGAGLAAEMLAPQDLARSILRHAGAAAWK